MILLLDTHVLLWSVRQPERLTQKAQTLLNDPRNELVFSVVSIWEVAIKHAAREDFNVDPALLRRGLLANRFIELPVQSLHAIWLLNLPPIHKDPFDRMLVAQAAVEGCVLLTADARMVEYGDNVWKI